MKLFAGKKVAAIWVAIIVMAIIGIVFMVFHSKKINIPEIPPQSNVDESKQFPGGHTEGSALDLPPMPSVAESVTSEPIQEVLVLGTRQK